MMPTARSSRGLSGRVNENRIAVGALFSLLDSGLDLGLRYMRDQPQRGGGLWEALVRAFMLGLAVTVVFGWIDRFKRYRELRRLS